jgi:hypothetical protein
MEQPMTAFLATEPRHALREYVPDPGAQTPACDEHEFAAIMEGMVADEAPRLFVVVQEYGERVDAVIAAWGMAFPEHAEIVAHRLRMSVRDPESALRMFDVGMSALTEFSQQAVSRSRNSPSRRSSWTPRWSLAIRSIAPTDVGPRAAPKGSLGKVAADVAAPWRSVC